MARFAIAIVLCVALTSCWLGLDFEKLERGSPSRPPAPPTECVADAPHDDDPRHCGACGHDCLGGACVGGRCQPVLLAQGLPGIAQIRELGDTLFATVPSGGKVVRVSKSGGAYDVLALDENAFNLAIADGRVYYTSAAGAARVSVNGGPIERLDGDGIGGIAADPTYSYRCVYGGGLAGKSRVERRRHDDGSLLVYASGFTGCETVELAGDAVLYGENGLAGAQGVWKAPREGGTPIELADRAARRIAADASDAYFIQYYDGDVRRVPLAGGPDVVVASTSPTQIGAGEIALDETYVYWVVAKPADEGGAVYRARKSGGSAEAFAGKVDSPLGITVDERAIYWTQDRAGVVMKLAK